MKILHTVEFYEPRKGGAEEVVRQLSERMVKLGHQVTVATTIDSRRKGFINGVKIEQFDIRGNTAHSITAAPGEVERYEALLCENFDIVLNYAAQSWPTDIAFRNLYRIKGKKILVPCGYSGLHNPAYQKYFEKLPEYLREYDSLVYMSKEYQDKKFGDEHGLGEKAVYIPNGAAGEEFESEDLFNFKQRYNINTPYLAICVANHYVAKGHDFIISAFNKLKRKDVSLAIIGKKTVSTGMRTAGHYFFDYLHCKLSSILHPRIKLIDTDDRRAVLSAYKQANLFLFGSRIECAPLVMYESFASRTPFITRLVGNVADHKEALKIVETPAEMARVANYILDDPETGKAITDRAYALWQKDHTWEKITGEYLELYKKAC